MSSNDENKDLERGKAVYTVLNDNSRGSLQGTEYKSESETLKNISKVSEGVEELAFAGFLSGVLRIIPQTQQFSVNPPAQHWRGLLEKVFAHL